MTGFGLGGHATEMAVASERTIVIDTEKLPVLPDVEKFASMGLIPGGAYRNREFAEKTGVKSQAVLWREDVVFDPQTSGGLLVAIPENEAKKALKEIEALGLVGNGFPLEEAEGKKVFLIGGGIGIPPMLETAKQLKAKKTAVLGYRDELFLNEEFA